MNTESQFSDRHMVSAGHHLAAEAAREILDAGGNAADAGVCGGICLAVLLSEYVNFSGVAPIIYREHATGKVITISGLGGWPKKASLAAIHRNHGGKIPLGILRTVVPGAPDAWISALQRFGTMTFGEVAAAAIRFAGNGFPVTALSAEIYAAEEAELRRWRENERIYLPKGVPLKAGEILKLSDLAGSLRYMADEEASAASNGNGRVAGLEAARWAFYQGDIARKIVSYHEEHGGWLTLEDLASFRVEIERASRSSFCGLDIYTCGPWCQGPLLSEILNILEAYGITDIEPNSLPYIHTLIEAMKLGFADRHAYYGDPRFVPVPMEILSSPAYAEARAREIDPEAACSGMPSPGKIPGWDGKTTPVTDGEDFNPQERDTSFVCVIDRWGNCFAATPSDVNSTAPVIPGTGLIPSPRGSQSFEDPAHPACLAPGKRPRLTPNPAIAIRPGRWAMPMGTPGNDVQVQAMVEVLLNIHLHGTPVQSAINAPRFATMSFPQTSTPHDYHKDVVFVEDRMEADICDHLVNAGHRVKMWREYDWRAGAVCAIKRDEKTGRLEGGADPRRPTGIA